MADEIIQAFNSVYADGPSSEPDEPDKGRIRQEIGPTIQYSVDAAKGAAVQVDEKLANYATVAQLNALAEDVEGASEGLVRFATWAQLSSVAGTRVGQPGQATSDSGTHTDPVVGGTVNNKGEYRWSTSPAGWQRVGDLIDQPLLETVSLSEQVVFSGLFGSVYVDAAGILGQVRTIYLPRQFSLKRSGVNISLTSMGTESTRWPGMTEVQYASGATLYTVYIDTTNPSDPYKLSSFSTAAISRAQTNVPLLTIWQNRVQDRYCDVRYVEDDHALPALLNPIVVENGQVFVPNAFVHSDTIATFTDRMFYKEVAFGSGSTAQILYWDHIAFLKGLDPWVIGAYPSAPRSSVLTAVLQYFQGHFYALNGAPVLGETRDGAIPNLMPTGKANPELADIKIATNVLTDITDSALLALGITKGYASPTGSFNHYGCLLLDSAPGRWVFVRAYVQTGVDNDFGTVTGFFVTPSQALNSPFALVREKTFSARAASFVGWAKMPSDKFYTGVWAGAVGTGLSLVVAGVQVGYGSTGRSWVRRDDYPTAEQSADRKTLDLISSNDAPADPHLLYPADMYLIEGRPMPFYASACLKERREGSNIRVTVETLRSGSAYLPVVHVVGDSDITLDPAAVGGYLRITARRTLASDKAKRRYVDVSTHVASASSVSGGTIRPLFIGDSLTEITGVPAATRRKLVSLGGTVTMIGTVDVTETGGAGTVKAEGRSSRRFNEYTGEDQSRTVPVAPGDEPVYQSMTTTDKRGYNPFLRAAIGGDPSEYVFGGYIFDLSFYLSRFSLAQPTHIVINLGTNDLSHLGTVDGAASVEDGITILSARIRATHPSVPIAFVCNQQPRTATGDAFWEESQVVNIETHFSTLKTIGDAGAKLLPGFAHQSPEVGWELPTPSTDSITSEETSEITDILHFERVGSEQLAEVVTAWIANHL